MLQTRLWVRLTACLLLAASLTTPARSADDADRPLAQAGAGDFASEDQTEALAPAEDADPPSQIAEQRLVELVMALTDRDGDEAAAKALIQIANEGDDRATLALARVYDNKVLLFEGTPVYVAQRIADDSGTLLPESYQANEQIAAKLAMGQTIDVGAVYPLFSDNDVVANTEPQLIPTDLLENYRAQRNARRLIKPVINVLALKSRNAPTRAAAAKKIGDSREVEALPLLETLAVEDPHWKVRYIAEESVQLMVALGAVPDTTPQQRLDAVQRLGEMDSVRAFAQLQTVRDGLEADDPDLAIYDTAINKISRHISLTNWISNTFFGLSAGSILVLMALGLAITFGLMGVINMAHGEMLMIGAVTTYLCYELIGKLLPPAYFDWFYLIAFPVAFLAAALVGLLTEVTIVRWLYKRPLDSLLATIGVSLILIQLVRNQLGDNLGIRRPGLLTGGWEVMLDVTLGYSRLFLIGLAIFCVLLVVGLFRYTKIGLMIRATVQNREMAQSLGVNTRLVDMFTFSFGTGLAGLAGFGIYLISNVTPEMGQGYIVQSFLVTVVGGVGKLIGVIASGLGIGVILKVLEPIVIIEEPTKIFDAVWAYVAVTIMVVMFITRRPAGLFPDKGRLADQQTGESTPWLAAKAGGNGRDLVIGSALMFIGLIVIPLLYITGYIGTGDLNKYGQWVSFAICAIGLDLLWGYMGILSLCQFMFFAFGGYAMGLYLIMHGPMRANGIPECLAYVMSDVGGGAPPFFLAWFVSFPLAMFLGLLLPAVFAFLLGVLMFRSRVRGVYFAIITQAITVAMALVFQKNDLKLGGTNGLTFDTSKTTLLGFPIAQPAGTPWYELTRFWLYIASVLALLAVILFAKWLVGSRFGRVLVAIRDDETRLRFAGYTTWTYKAAIFTIAGAIAALAGMLYVPQKGIITPHQLAAFASIMVVIWVAVGGRGSLWGPVIGAIFVSFVYDRMSSIAPNYWKIVLGGLFIAVPLVLPGGLMSLPQVAMSLLRGGGSAGTKRPADVSAGVAGPKPAGGEA